MKHGAHNMSVNLHYKYAVRIGVKWITVNDKDKYDLTSDQKKAATRWDIRGALGIQERYLKAAWNLTMGDKPTMVVVKVHRPQIIHHWW